MIKSLTAYTEEIDEVEEAVADILQQLDIENNLLTHSAGIITCYSEFTKTGIIEALCARLPFPVVGTTTLGVAMSEQSGMFMFGIVVFTSDDTMFSAALSGSLSENGLSQPIADVYARAAAALPAPPSLMFTFAPMLFQFTGDQYVQALDEASSGVPNFGTVVIDHTFDYREARVICNGETVQDGMAVLLLSGEVSPAFCMVSIEKNKLWRQSAIVTDSEDNLLKEVNNLPFTQFMETLGLAKGSVIEPGSVMFPFVLDYNDGSQPVVRAYLAASPEGYGICGGFMPVGSKLSIATIDRNDVLSTTATALSRITREIGDRTLLSFSCIGRNLALGADSTAEMQLLVDTLGDSHPYLFAYSGGEICPVVSENGQTVNRFHNDTFVACLL